MRKVTTLAAVMNFNHEKDVELLLHSGRKKLLDWKIGDHLGHLLTLV